jgi:hypothetical protein
MKGKYIALLVVSILNHLPKFFSTNLGIIYLSCTVTSTLKKNCFLKSNIDIKMKYINI